jgi:hypothetical protein
MLQLYSSASTDDKIIAHVKTLIREHQAKRKNSSLTRGERLILGEYIEYLYKVVQRRKIAQMRNRIQ